MNCESKKIEFSEPSLLISEEKIQMYFEQFGDLHECIVEYDKYTGKPRGSGYVIYKDIKSVDSILNKKHAIDGLQIICNSPLKRNENINPRNSIHPVQQQEKNDEEIVRKRFEQENIKLPINSNYYANNVDPTQLISVCLEFLYGIKDSLMLKNAFELVWASRMIKSLLFKTFLINGVLIVGSSFILKFFSKGRLFQSESELIQTIFSVLYHLFYLYPLYFCSLVMNSFDYMDMAAGALSLEKKKSRNKGPSADILTRIYNEVINALFLIFFLLQGFVLSFIPYLGPILHLISQSFTYAFYCFTYKWGTDQADLYRILAFFDKHFFYFSGFGFIYAIVTRIFPGLVGSGVYAALFPVFLLLSIKARPPKDLCLNDLTDLNRHLRTMLDTKEEVIEYDDIDTFDYKGFCLSLQSQIGAFTFPLIGINFVGRYLDKKVQA